MQISPCMRILGVDDDADSCEILEVLLTNDDARYRVTTVSDAFEALEMLGKEPFDLYILDYRLPEMSGIDLCRTIRLLDRRVPIVFFSGMSYERHKSAAFHAGATEYLVKPNDLEILTETVRKLLNRNSAASDGNII